MIDLTLEHVDFASAAQPVAAGMRQIHTGTQRGIQQRLLFFSFDGFVERFNGDLKAHSFSPHSTGRVRPARSSPQLPEC